MNLGSRLGGEQISFDSTCHQLDSNWTSLSGRFDLARVDAERKRNFIGQHFWARGYLTVGRDKAVVRECFKTKRRRAQR